MLWRSLLASLLLNLTFFSDGLIDQMELDELDLNSEISLKYRPRFAEYISKHRLNFESDREHADAFSNYLRNSIFIEHMNKIPEHTFILGETRFTHMSKQQYGKIMNKRSISTSQSKPSNDHALASSMGTIPLSFDWSTTPAVTPVRDQGSCGSCWAFATVAALESAFYLKYYIQKTFSEEQLVSCDKLEDGCGGGNPHRVYSWVSSNNGITTSDQFPYISGTLGYTWNKNCGQALFLRESRLSNVTVGRVQSLSSAALMAAIVQQPVVVFMDGSSAIFQNYVSGIINSAACGQETTHTMLAVGYGVQNGVSYIKLKNSFGTQWGEEGFILIASDDNANYCAVLTDASYPILH